MTDKTPILEVRNLRTVFHDEAGAWPAIDGIDLSLWPGEVLGLVGESGSGKSVAGFSILGLIDPPGEIVDGEIIFQGQNLLELDDEQLRRLRGASLAMVFQDPLTTLNPLLTIGEQMIEAITEHEAVLHAQARRRSVDSLRRVGITSPEVRMDQYPHELSGGMRQRVSVAIAMLGNPALIIADEPTTALDVTIQGQIIAEIQQLQADMGASLIWISHDLGVVAELADRIAVMYAGLIVEMGPASDVLDRPRHPYTRGLLDSMPGDAAPGHKLRQIPGAAPPISARPLGCPFHPRCSRATDICRSQEPARSFAPSGQNWLCHHPLSNEVTP